MNTEKYFEKRKQDLINEVKRLEKEIKKMPNMTLFCVNSNNYVKWYARKDSDELIYLSKRKEKNLAEKLAYKKYALLKIEDIKDEIKAIEEYQRIYSDNSHRAEKLCRDLRYRDLILATIHPVEMELKEWLTADYPRDTNYLDGLKHDTGLGFKVRSKSEAAIARELFSRGIPFHYEEKLELNDPVFGTRAIYPDFTCRNIKTGRTLYWEHLGMMSEPEYINSCTSKLAAMAKNGIVVGINLIVTAETRDEPLTYLNIDKTIDLYFGEMSIGGQKTVL